VVTGDGRDSRTGTLMGSGDGSDTSCDDRSVMGRHDGDDENT
jgi:hypothetical protein